MWQLIFCMISQKRDTWMSRQLRRPTLLGMLTLGWPFQSRAALSLLAYCYFYMQDFVNAANCYEHLTLLFPDIDEYRLYYAQSLYQVQVNIFVDSIFLIALLCLSAIHDFICQDSNSSALSQPFKCMKILLSSEVGSTMNNCCKSTILHAYTVWKIEAVVIVV